MMGDGLVALSFAVISLSASRGGDLPALKDFFSMERHRTKTLGGLLTRVAAKVAAYTCALNGSTTPLVAHCATWWTC
jgi:hypothetical protein